MAFASSNAMSFRYAPVSVFDGTMAAAAYRVLPVNAQRLGHNKITIRSQRLRSDYGVHAIIEVGAEGTGTIPFELDMLNFSDLFEALFFNSWSGGSPLQPAAAPTGTGGTLTNGALEKYLDIEVAQTDLTAEFMHFASFVPGQTTIRWQPRERVLCDTTFIGHSGAVATATTTTSVVAEVASSVAPVLNATDDVATIEIDDTPVVTKVRGITLTINPNLQALSAVGEKYAVGINRGEWGVSGTLDLYDDNAARDFTAAFISHTRAKLKIPMVDSTTSALDFTVPGIHYTDGSPESPGVNQPNQISLPFEAEAVSGIMAQLDLTPA